MSRVELQVHNTADEKTKQVYNTKFHIVAGYYRFNLSTIHKKFDLHVLLNQLCCRFLLFS